MENNAGVAFVIAHVKASTRAWPLSANSYLRINRMFFHHNRGFSLIELMVSLTIFAIGILAITRLQFLSFRIMNQGLLRTVAIEEASNLLVRYRVLRQREVFNASFAQWQNDLSRQLPQATIVFSALGPFCTFHLKWQPLAALFNPAGMPLDLVDELDYSG